MRLRLVPKSLTLDDPERPLCTLLHYGVHRGHLYEYRLYPAAKNVAQ